MSRGFDFDDIRDSIWDSDPRRESHTLESFGLNRESRREGRSRPSDPSTKIQLATLRSAESASDRAISRSREREDLTRGTGPADLRNPENLRDRNRREYRGRDRVYSLRASEVRTITEIGKFRVINVEDLAQLAYAGDRARLSSDLRNLTEQGLIQGRGTSALKKASRQVVTLTKPGERLIRRHGFVHEDQAIYSGLVKSEEADHDSTLHRLYQKAAAEIEGQGGKILRIQLDYELKEQLYRKLGRAKVQDRTEALQLKNGYAQQLYLPVVNGKVSFPDLRIEYVNQDMEIGRVDLELATRHYHASHLAEKARAGFQIHARSEDAAGLRRVRDDREIMTSILSL